MDIYGKAEYLPTVLPREGSASDFHYSTMTIRRYFYSHKEISNIMKTSAISARMGTAVASSLLVAGMCAGVATAAPNPTEQAAPVPVSGTPVNDIAARAGDFKPGTNGILSNVVIPPELNGLVQNRRGELTQALTLDGAADGATLGTGAGAAIGAATGGATGVAVGGGLGSAAGAMAGGYLNGVLGAFAGGLTGMGIGCIVGLPAVIIGCLPGAVIGGAIGGGFGGIYGALAGVTLGFPIGASVGAGILGAAGAATGAAVGAPIGAAAGGVGGAATAASEANSQWAQQNLTDLESQFQQVKAPKVPKLVG